MIPRFKAGVIFSLLSGEIDFLIFKLEKHRTERENLFSLGWMALQRHRRYVQRWSTVLDNEFASAAI